MWRRGMLLSVVLAMGLLASPLSAAPSVIIDQSGFDPQDVDLGESTTDRFTATFSSGIANVEIPNNQLSYQWSIESVQCDPDFGTDYGDAEEGDYDVALADATQQNCSLTAAVYAEGNWMITIKVVVTYPDGYCCTQIERFHNRCVGPGAAPRLACNVQIELQKRSHVSL